MAKQGLKIQGKISRYLIMDARGFQDAGVATILCTSNTEAEAIKDTKMFGDYLKFEVCIYDTKADDVAWHLYAEASGLPTNLSELEDIVAMLAYEERFNRVVFETTSNPRPARGIMFDAYFNKRARGLAFDHKRD